MNTTVPLSLRIHDVLTIVRHVCTALSLISAVPTLTVIGLCANRVSKRYAVLLAMIVIEVNVMICLLLVLGPLMLLPDTCMLRQNPIIPIPGGANLYFELWVGVTTMNVPLFFACFLERHQAVQSPLSRWLISMRVRYCLLLLIIVAVLSITVILKVAEMPHNAEQVLLQTLVDRWPTIPVLGASCFDYLLFTVFSTAGVCGLIAGTVVTALISWHTLYTLQQASSLSETMKKFNLTMTKVLMVQAIFPTLLILLPLLFSLVAVITHIEGPLPFSTCYLCMTVYALLHSIVQLTVSPMHRKKGKEILKRIIGKASVSVSELMVISTSL